MIQLAPCIDRRLDQFADIVALVTEGGMTPAQDHLESVVLSNTDLVVQPLEFAGGVQVELQAGIACAPDREAATDPLGASASSRLDLEPEGDTSPANVHASDESVSCGREEEEDMCATVPRWSSAVMPRPPHVHRSAAPQRPVSAER